jgi:hypothetical protein
MKNLIKLINIIFSLLHFYRELLIVFILNFVLVRCYLIMIHTTTTTTTTTSIELPVLHQLNGCFLNDTSCLVLSLFVCAYVFVLFVSLLMLTL